MPYGARPTVLKHDINHKDKSTGTKCIATLPDKDHVVGIDNKYTKFHTARKCEF